MKIEIVLFGVAAVLLAVVLAVDLYRKYQLKRIAKYVGKIETSPAAIKKPQVQFMSARRGLRIGKVVGSTKRHGIALSVIECTDGKSKAIIRRQPHTLQTA